MPHRAPATIEGKDFLAFAGVPSARHRIYRRVVHVAEKLHAHTLPRPRENSRVKDLPGSLRGDREAVLRSAAVGAWNASAWGRT